MGAVGRMVGGGEVVQAIVTSAFPILRLDTVPLVALAVAGCCLLLLWVILRWRQEPQMPEMRETHPHPTSLDSLLGAGWSHVNNLKKHEACYFDQPKFILGHTRRDTVHFV